MAKKTPLAQRIGKAAFDRTKRGKETAASRPRREKPAETRGQRFDNEVNREMRSGTTRAEAISRAMDRARTKL